MTIAATKGSKPKTVKACSSTKQRFCTELDRLLLFNNDWSRNKGGFSAIELTDLRTFKVLPISGVIFRGKGLHHTKPENVQLRFCPFCAKSLDWKRKEAIVEKPPVRRAR